MNTRVFKFIIVLSIIFIGCKNERNKNIVDESKQEINKNSFVVIVDVVVKKDDDFQIYFTDRQTKDFNEEKSVWVKVKASELSQKVIFILPKGIIPTLLRLDFGLNKEQKDIIISEIEIHNSDKKLELKGIEIANYFRPLEPTKIDFVSGVMNAIDKNGQRVEPVLHPQEIPLAKEIVKLVI